MHIPFIGLWPIISAGWIVKMDGYWDRIFELSATSAWPQDILLRRGKTSGPLVSYEYETEGSVCFTE
jgi:hypothetical protein